VTANRFWSAWGLGAVFCLQSATLPTVLRILGGEIENLPPFDFILLLELGILGMVIRHYYYIQDKISLFSGLFGLYSNLIILLTIQITAI